MKRQQGLAFPTPFLAEVASAAAVGLVVAAVGTLVIGLFFAKAPVVVASVFCAVFAKIALEIGRRGAAAAEEAGDLAAAPRHARSGNRHSVASGAMATRPPGRGDPLPGEDEDEDWRFDELFEGDASGGRDEGRRVPAGGQQRRAPAARETLPAGGAPPPAQPRRIGGGGGDLDESLDRFGEHLVRSLNQLFDEYVAEALGQMQAELSAERKDLADLRGQLKAVVKAGARREETLREEMNVNRESLDDLRAQVEELREELGGGGRGRGDSQLQDDIAALTEEVRALRKRVSLGGSRRPGGTGLDRDQVQAIADAVTATILDNIAIEPG